MFGMKILLTLFVLFFTSSAISEIVTLDDGRVIDLKADGTFTVISNKANNIDNSFHDSIIFLLDLSGVTYETINFLDDSSFVLKNINIENSMQIEELTLIGLNREYFQNFSLKKFDTYKGKLFNKLSIKNYSLIEDGGFKNNIGLIEINELDIKKIHILKILIESALGISSIPDVADILLVIDSFNLNKMIINDFELTDIDMNGHWSSLVINNLKDSSLGNLYYTDLEFNDVNEIIKVDKFEINHLIFNRPTTYNINWNEFNLLNDPLILFSFFKSLRRVNIIGYYLKEKSSGIEVVIDESEIADFNTKKINNLSIPISFKARTSGTKISTINNLLNTELKKLNYNEIKFDSELILEWNTTFNTFAINYQIGMQNGFDLSIEAQIDNLNINLINLIGIYPDLMNSLMAEPGIKKVKISFQDKGLTNRLINYVALDSNMTKNEFIDHIIEQIESDEIIESSLKEDFIIKLIKFLQQPNRIAFSINPTTPLSYEDFTLLVGNPNLLVELLNLKIE